MKFAVLLLMAGILSEAYAAPVAPTLVSSVEGVTEYRLANGMRVLLLPDPGLPTLTTRMVYMVGAHQENDDEAGMARLLDTVLRNRSAYPVSKAVSTAPLDTLKAAGASFGGGTWSDHTEYSTTVDANIDTLRTALALEADRMVHAVIDKKAASEKKTPAAAEANPQVAVKAAEQRAVLALSETAPVNVTTRRIRAIAYGERDNSKAFLGAYAGSAPADFQHLQDFYHRYYQPDNATLIVSGRFDLSILLQQINAQFGRIPASHRALQPARTVEAAQDGEREVTVRRKGDFQFVGAGYHVAPLSHPDAAALEVLKHILLDAPAGRMHQALIEAKLATSLTSASTSNTTSGYLQFGAAVAKDGKLDTTQGVLLKTLENLKAQPVTEDEVANAKAALAKEYGYAQNNTAQLSLRLVDAMMAGDWRLFFVQRDWIEKADVKSVQGVAEKYLVPSNRTLGRFVASAARDRITIPTTDVNALVKDYRGGVPLAPGEAFDASPANIEARTERFTLTNGMKAALLSKNTKGSTVKVAMRLHFGTEDSLRGKALAGSAAGDLLLHGTEHMSRQELQAAFDKLKAEVSAYGSAEGATVSVSSTRANLPATLALLAEALRTPAYTLADLAACRQTYADPPEVGPMSKAIEASRRLFIAEYQQGEQVPEQQVSVEQVRAFHDAYYGANYAVFAAVGDFDAAALKIQLGELFGNWTSPQPYAPIHHLVKPVVGARETVQTPGEIKSVQVVLWPLSLRDDDPAYPDLLMANQILGTDQRSRLTARVHRMDGLSEAWAHSVLTVPPRSGYGMWATYVISAPEDTAKVEVALREELDHVLTDGFTTAELSDAKKSWLHRQQLELGNDYALASRLVLYLDLNRTMDYDRKLEAEVASLTTASVGETLRQQIKPTDVTIIRVGDFAKAKQD